MNYDEIKKQLCGCYVTVPTLFKDTDLSVNQKGIEKHVEFLISDGIRERKGVLLAGGAAGDFSTMTLEERVSVCETVVSAADGQVPVAFGAQTTSTRELIELAKAAASAGAKFIQVSPPFYFSHTEDDFFEYIVAAANSADIGIIIYNTFWTSLQVSEELIDRLADIPQVVGLKWSVPDTDWASFESSISKYSSRFSIIDNQLRFVTSHMLGARGIEVHTCNYWPQWGVRMWEMLENQSYVEAQVEIMKVVIPFMDLWKEMEQYSGGDGYLDKLCMELVGMDSSRNRPPTRDLRNQFRHKAHQMMAQSGVPRLIKIDS